MFNEAAPIPGGENEGRKEQDVVFKGTVEKPKKESWLERIFGAKETPDSGSTPVTAAAQPAEDSHHHETDFKRYTAREIAEKERVRETNRKIDLERAREEYVPPKPKEIETDTASDNKESPQIEEDDEPGL